MAHQYKRRTLDEAEEIARVAFRASVGDNLSVDEIEEVGHYALASSGSPSDDWQERLGFVPQMRDYYEYCLYKPSNAPPYVEKYYAKILVARDRKSDFCQIIWRPKVAPYDGPWYS